MTITRSEAIAEARAMGVDAAKCAASWTTDMNTKPEFVPAVLRMAEEGDPALYDYLPAMPDLSGEWADGPTPQSLAADILGADWETFGYNAPDFLPAEIVAELCEAWEEGVSEVFEDACLAELRKVIA